MNATNANEIPATLTETLGAYTAEELEELKAWAENGGHAWLAEHVVFEFENREQAKV